MVRDKRGLSFAHDKMDSEAAAGTKDMARGTDGMGAAECADCAGAPDDRNTQPATEDLMDPKTFIPPLTPLTAAGLPGPCVIIEYCQRCKFGLRANWVQQEILSTFADSVASVLVVPKSDEASAGRFRVYFARGHAFTGASQTQAHAQAQALELVWDRKTQAGFPEMKVLKQRLRDLVRPGQHLGHSDVAQP